MRNFIFYLKIHIIHYFTYNFKTYWMYSVFYVKLSFMSGHYVYLHILDKSFRMSQWQLGTRHRSNNRKAFASTLHSDSVATLASSVVSGHSHTVSTSFFSVCLTDQQHRPYRTNSSTKLGVDRCNHFTYCPKLGYDMCDVNAWARWKCKKWKCETYN